MKFPFFAFILLFTINALNASTIKIKYKDSSKTEKLETETIDKQEYVSLTELNKVFHSLHKIDFAEQKIGLTIYNESLSFLLNSTYFSCKGTVYNNLYQPKHEKDKYYLPWVLVEKNLPKIFPGKVAYQSAGRILTIEYPQYLGINTIVLDPGHGGRDPGAVGLYSSEKDIALQLVKKLQYQLESQLNVKVLLARDKDEFVSLQDRTKFANAQKANLFISIHCNAAVAKNSQGIEVFFLSTARTTESRAVETLENSVVFNYEGGQEAVKNYDDLSFILADMAQNEQLEESRDLAVRLQTNLINDTSSIDRGVKQAGFYVLRGAYMPAVLIEAGFISNEQEEKKLNDPNYQDLLVRSIFDGIRSFKYKIDQMQ